MSWNWKAQAAFRDSRVCMNPGKRTPSKISVVFMRSFMLVLSGVGLSVRRSVTQGPSSSQQVQARLPFHHEMLRRGHTRWLLVLFLGIFAGPSQNLGQTCLPSGPRQASSSLGIQISGLRLWAGNGVCLALRLQPTAWQNSASATSS